MHAGTLSCAMTRASALPLKDAGLLGEGHSGAIADLMPGQSYHATLDLGGYVEIQRPGKYTLEVLFHDSEFIADEGDVSGLIVFRTKPITLIVRPLVIELTAEERKQAEKWFAAINTKLPVHHVGGMFSYGPVVPDTPQGQLLKMGVKAIPVLMKSLNESFSSEERAWILSLLFGVTGRNDPQNPEHYAAGAFMTTYGEEWHRSIDRNNQEWWIDKWKAWYKYVEVKEISSDAPQRPAAGDAKRTK